MLSPGVKAPAWTLNDLEGRSHSLGELTAKGPLSVVFFKSSCPVCQMTMPFVDRIARASPAAAWVAISQDDVKTTRRFMEHFGIAMPVLLDPYDKYPASNAYKITHVPTFFVVSPEGVIEHSFTGFVKDELAALGSAAGIATFGPDEEVPALRPG